MWGAHYSHWPGSGGRTANCGGLISKHTKNMYFLTLSFYRTSLQFTVIKLFRPTNLLLNTSCMSICRKKFLKFHRLRGHISKTIFYILKKITKCIVAFNYILGQISKTNWMIFLLLAMIPRVYCFPILIGWRVDFTNRMIFYYWLETQSVLLSAFHK